MADDDFLSFKIRLEGVVAESTPLLTEAMGRNLLHLQSILAQIPAQPPRDRAKTFNTYVRNVGRLPKSSFFTSKGVLRKTITTKNAKIARTSEQSSKRWHTSVEAIDGNVIGTLENTASYSGWVWGTKDTSKDPHQVSQHAETGWANADDAVAEAMTQIDEINAKLLKEIVDRLAE